MGPIILCDKSSLQALGPKELNNLRRYFFTNVPPVLLVEIIGDLKKPTETAMGEKQVKSLARKLVPACCMVNLDFRVLLQSELEGQPIPMDRRPVVAPNYWAWGPGGEVGSMIEEQPEAVALMRWQEGRFRDAEMLLAHAWRAMTKSIDLEAMRNGLRAHYSPQIRLQSLDVVRDHVDSLLATNNVRTLLAWFLRDIEVPVVFIQPTIERFLTSGSGPLAIRAPLTFHCLRVALLFHFALAFGLIGTRSTNRVDMEYLFYTPFCNVFSSGDTLHRQFAPLVLADDQMFVERDELRADLAQLAAKVSNLSWEKQQEDLRRIGPPADENSVTHRIWTRFMKPGYASRKRLTLTPDQEKRLVEEAMRRVKGAPVEAPADKGPLPQGDYAVRHFSMALDGPCFCGSTRTLRECCGRNLA
jgi:hypothetical protein